jgi:NADPH:quinone reductase-like Zn-dependent oxidoreductase
MRAVVHDRYGSPEVLRLADVPPPVPRPDEVLVRVHATTVNRTDCAIRGGGDLVTRLGYSYVTTGSWVAALRRPKQPILGSEVAGVVEAIGADVRAFSVGDRVFGVNAGRFGAHAELVCVREGGPLTTMPDGLTFEEAAAIPDGAILALNALRPAAIREGERVLVYGASGAIGTAGVQLAKSFGAHVTAACGTRNLGLVRSLGADEVIDYRQQDFTATGARYDVIFDAVGKHAFSRCRRSLAPGGRYVPTDGWINALLAVVTPRVGRRRVVINLPPRYTQEDMVLLKGLIEAGRYRAVVDRTWPLERVVEATAYVETERKTGSVVLVVGPPEAG